MKRRKRLIGVWLVITALIIMQLPVSEADAAESSASDFTIEGSTLVKYRGKDANVNVPNTVEVIGESAFENNTYVELVVLPNSVKRIDQYAFWGCDNLDTVVLGKGINVVGDYAFAGCKGLEQMSIPSNVTAIGVQAFADCVNLKDISIPAATISIHETAFDGCYQLTIHCDEGTVADRFAQAFYEKQSEMAEYQDVPGYDSTDGSTDDGSDTGNDQSGDASQSATVPDYSDGNVIGSTKIVGNQAVFFINASGLDTIDGADYFIQPDTPAIGYAAEETGSGLPKFAIVDGAIVADQAYYRSGALGQVSLPVGIREIGQFSFARSSVTSVTLPQGVSDICYGAFYHCDDLASVELPDTVQNVEPKAFEHTAWVENFLNGTTGEGDFLISGGVLVAYRGISSQVTIPDGVRVIAAEVFRGHEEITSVTMPESLTVIGEGAFENCKGLVTINLNRGLRRVKDRAFFGCGARQVVVPASVNEVGLKAFEGIDADYALNGPENTYETSATRLSNEDYRTIARAGSETAGVTVIGPEGITADLQGAARRYTLTIAESQTTTAMERGFLRAFGSNNMPGSIYIYDMTFTDGSGIPLTKLGRQALTVVMPVPEFLAGQELKLYLLDRNGQLEECALERVSVDGREAVRFSTNLVSQFALCPTGAASNQEIMELNVDMESMSAPPAAQIASIEEIVKFFIGGIVLFIGVILILTGSRKRRIV